ncbi:hypothetical protein GQ53DRAFT_91369 [Thozetella sp. PMI_491]|nr:hypothetical protein GQ53DRAFT_91369 [Thozetella sp. PMI_491]
MPTPSSNAPDPQSPRPHPFSCPDPTEESLAEASSQQDDHPPQSPSSWHPNPPLPYADEIGRGIIEPTTMEEDTDTLRSATLSPHPLSVSTHERDMEPEGMLITRDSTEDHHKQVDSDEDLMTAVAEPSSATSAVGDGESSRGLVAEAEVGRGAAGESYEFGSRILTEDDLESWDATTGSRWMQDSGLAGLGYEYSHKRLVPAYPSRFLRPGSRFTGTQTSERQRYDVQVEIKSVDLRESSMCGYLRIQGLTDDHPTLTTYFEGEIIGPKYGFITQHPSWGASEKIDLSHWSKFTAFRPYSRLVRKGGRALIKDAGWTENIFMRWKEHFLVPDHQVRTINGASFEGFYYICFNQLRGDVSGIYFHSKSEQ